MSSPRFLTATVDHFYETGEWPSLKLLQNVLTELEDTADARREAKRLPYGHGQREDNLVVLSVRGIFGAEPNHRLLRDFEHALELAIHLYRHGEKREEATLSYRTLIDRHAFSKAQAKRAIAMLEAESLVADAGRGAEIKVIQPRIRLFLRVRDVEEYVRKKKTIDRCLRVKRLVEKPRKALRWFGSEETTIRDKVLVAVLAALATAVLSVALYLTIGSGAAHGGSDRGASRHAAKVRGGADQSRRSAAARSGG